MARGVTKDPAFIATCASFPPYLPAIIIFLSAVHHPKEFCHRPIPLPCFALPCLALPRLASFYSGYTHVIILGTNDFSAVVGAATRLAIAQTLRVLGVLEEPYEDPIPSEKVFRFVGGIPQFDFEPAIAVSKRESPCGRLSRGCSFIPLVVQVLVPATAW